MAYTDDAGAATTALAQGVLMDALGLCPEDAGLVLLTRADEQGRTVVEVARDVVARVRSPSLRPS
jgi:hypothetical protein